MTYNKRRYRRVTTNGKPVTRLNWSGTKVSMLIDGTWWVNGVGNLDAPNRPLPIALDGMRIDPFAGATEHQKRYGIVTFYSYPSMAPTDYGVKSGRAPERRAFEDRFKPVAGGLRVPR